MGKNKAQRTKNNAKPSNSSRSAELLGTSMPNFVGFSAVKDGGYIPVLPGLSLGGMNEVEINAIDTSFQLALKKMNKKDVTTKFKALQEFAELCKQSELPLVEAVLPFWPRWYCLLCIDVEHRVREAAQMAHTALVKRVGRSIAVYLKQVAGPWFTSQFDTYPPAASEATNSFQDTFPQRKIVDAIIHCQEEILSYIADTITVQTPQSMSTHKALTTEELETKYQRVLIASLQAYSAYLRKIPPAQIEKTEKSHQQIIGSSKFWKLAKHESLLVKTAFFNVLASIIDNATVLLKDEKKRAMTAIMNSLDETEPGLLLAVWESMLVAINKIEDWHLSVSIEKLVLPKLWRVLNSGGQCCASVVYPNLLPFVSQFAKFNIDNKTLFVNFFTHMRQGFSAKSVLMSRSEMFAVTKSFVECLRYAVLLHKDDQELCDDLLKNQLMPVIEYCITEPGLSRSILFCEVTQLLRYWSKNRGSPEYKAYAVLLAKFWTELEEMFANLLIKMDESYENSSNVHDTQIELLLNLKNAPTHSRKNLRVKFSDPDEPVEKKGRPKTTEVEDDEQFHAELDSFVNNLCVVYLNRNASVPTDKNIQFLIRLVSHFESEKLFADVARAYRGNPDLLEFYEKVLRKWLIEKTVSSESAIQLVFSALRYMNDTSKEIVLKSVTELDDPSVLRSAVICALAEKSRSDRVVRNWCLEPRVTEQLSDLVRKIISDEGGEDFENDANILALAFEPAQDGEFCVSEEAIVVVTSILCDHLVEENSSHLPNIVELISRLLTLTYDHKRLTSGSVKMLKSLFELSLRDPLNAADVPYADSIRDTWKCGFIRFNEKMKRDELVELHRQCMDIIHEKIYNSNDPQVEDALVEITVDFVEAASSFDPGDALRSAIEFNTRDKILTEEWIPRVLGIVLYGEILCGNFYLPNPIRSVPASRPFEPVALKDEVLPDQTNNCLKWASFNSKLLNQLIAKLDEDDMNDEVDSGVIDCLADLPYILNYIILIASLGHVYSTHYKSAKNYENIASTLETLVAECSKLRERVPKDIWNRILTDSLSVEESWLEYGSLFSQFLRLFYGSEEHLSEVDRHGPKILAEYIDSDDNSLQLAEDINAVATARSILSSETNSKECVAVLERMVKRHQTPSPFLLLDRDISDVEWAEIALPLGVIRLFSKFVRVAPTKLSPGLWDAAVIFLASWQLSVNKSKHRHEDSKVRALIVAVSELYYEMQTLLSKHEQESIEDLPSTLLDEWKNLFADDVHLGMANTWIFYVDLYNKKSDHLMPGIVLNHLSKAMSVIDGNAFFKILDTAQSRKIGSNEMIDLSLKLLSSSVPCLQLAAYHVLSRLIPKLVEQDKLLLEGENCESKDLNIKKFEEVLSSTQRIVNAMLMGFKLCDTVSCAIQPFTDSYTYTIGYLLAWANVLDMCAQAHADLRYQYAESLKDNYFPFLLNNIFRLMPVEVLQDNKSKASKLTEDFSTLPSLEFQESWTEWRLDHIVCWVYTNSLRHLPVLTRQWWGTADSRVSAAVEKITTLYVSPMLCHEELHSNRLGDIKNMQIKVHPSVREVVALYHIDDTKLELSMVLPHNHPLGTVYVEPGQHAGGTATFKNCHMQLSLFLSHQNGSIWEGLLMWKKNLDKKFSGVEECFICYSIFHINTYQIPKLSCHTCRKKFHAQCLYKWFTKSQKSTCPLCRNIF